MAGKRLSADASSGLTACRSPAGDEAHYRGNLREGTELASGQRTGCQPLRAGQVMTASSSFRDSGVIVDDAELKNVGSRGLAVHRADAEQRVSEKINSMSHGYEMKRVSTAVWINFEPRLQRPLFSAQ